MSPDPIRVHCEGSGCPPSETAAALGSCSMCGQIVRLLPGNVVAGHDRNDILAMIERGDFG